MGNPSCPRTPPLPPAPASSAASHATLPIYSFGNIDWLHFFILVCLPALALHGIVRFASVFAWQSWALCVLMYCCCAYGITMGYHRLWSHRAFEASLPVRLLLAFFGAGSVQGSIRWWSRRHRYHHRFTDTELDPYNSKYGLFFSHVGWMLFRQPRVPVSLAVQKVSVADLDADWVVRVQHRFYLPLAVFASLIFPGLVAKLLWDDFLGGFYLAGMLRLVLQHHSTFSINSLAHWLGSANYDDRLTARDSLIVALVTFGEGYHNFHHQFPNDYRNGVRWVHFDPTKWMIRFLSFFGATSMLKRFPSNEIEMGHVAMLQKKVEKRAKKLVWPVAPELLPELSLEEVQRRCKSGHESLVIINDLVHEVSSFVSVHPGGEALLKGVIGRDATHAFHGGVYNHSRAAENLLSQMRVARLSIPLKEGA